MTWIRNLGLVLFSVGVAMCAGTAAGHPYAATYFADRSVTIEGVVAVFMYRNPHTILQVLTRESDGTSHRWACEWAGTLKLGTYGITGRTVKPGDKVIVTGYPGRNADDHRLLVTKIRRPADGWTWSGDSK